MCSGRLDGVSALLSASVWTRMNLDAISELSGNTQISPLFSAGSEIR